MAVSIPKYKSRVDIRGLELSMGIKWARGLSRHKGRLKLPDIVRLEEGWKRIVYDHGMLTNAELHHSTELRLASDRLVEACGPQLWPDGPREGGEYPDWLTDASDDNLYGLYPTNLYFSDPAHKERLKVTFNQWIIGKCIGYRANHYRTNRKSDIGTQSGGPLLGDEDAEDHDDNPTYISEDDDLPTEDAESALHDDEDGDWSQEAYAASRNPIAAPASPSQGRISGSRAGHHIRPRHEYAGRKRRASEAEMQLEASGEAYTLPRKSRTPRKAIVTLKISSQKLNAVVNKNLAKQTTYNLGSSFPTPPLEEPNTLDNPESFSVRSLTSLATPLQSERPSDTSKSECAGYEDIEQTTAGKATSPQLRRNYELAREVLGDLAASPVVSEHLIHHPMTQQQWGKLRDILHQFPEARMSIEVLLSSISTSNLPARTRSVGEQSTETDNLRDIPQTTEPSCVSSDNSLPPSASGGEMHPASEVASVSAASYDESASGEQPSDHLALDAGLTYDDFMRCIKLRLPAARQGQAFKAVTVQQIDEATDGEDATWYIAADGVEVWMYYQLLDELQQRQREGGVCPDLAVTIHWA